jgi:hypothetical protein
VFENARHKIFLCHKALREHRFLATDGYTGSCENACAGDEQGYNWDILLP